MARGSPRWQRPRRKGARDFMDETDDACGGRSSIMSKALNEGKTGGEREKAQGRV